MYFKILQGFTLGIIIAAFFFLKKKQLLYFHFISNIQEFCSQNCILVGINILVISSICIFSFSSGYSWKARIMKGVVDVMLSSYCCPFSQIKNRKKTCPVVHVVEIDYFFLLTFFTLVKAVFIESCIHIWVLYAYVSTHYIVSCVCCIKKSHFQKCAFRALIDMNNLCTH